MTIENEAQGIQNHSGVNVFASGIFVFKTNLANEKDVAAVAESLEHHPLVERWNVDLQDVDRVLRVESSGSVRNEIIQLLQDFGYQAEELPD